MTAPAVGDPASAITSTFDASDEGWVAFTPADGTSDSDIGNPRWESEGGNPDGHFAVEDEAAGGVIYYDAPSKFLGDHSGAYGTPLEYDVSSTTQSGSFRRDDVVLEGTNHRLLFRHEADPAPDGWKTSWAPLEEGPRWRIMDVANEWDGHNWEDLTAEPTATEFNAVLANLNAVYIRGEYWSGSTSLGLDNVKLFAGGETGVPEEVVDAHWLGGDGDWEDPANWSTDDYPNNDSPRMGYRYRAIIDEVGDYTVTLNSDIEVEDVEINSADAVLSHDGGTFTTAEVTLTEGAYALNGGTLKGATITGSDFAWSHDVTVNTNSTFEDVTLSTLELQLPSGKELDIRGDLTLDDATVRFDRTSYDYTRLRFVDGAEQTLAGQGEVIFDSGSSSRETRQQLVPVGSDAHLIIDAGITIRSGQSGGRIGDSNRELTNNGTIISETQDSAIDIYGGSFTNQGALVVRQGARLEVNGLAGDLNTVTLEDPESRLLLDGNFAINEDVDVPADSRLTIGGDWSNTATITATDATVDFNGSWSNQGLVTAGNSLVNLGGTFSWGGLGNFDRTGGTVRVTGTLENTGTTVPLDASTGDWNLHGATIVGGTFTASDDASLAVTANSTLQDVTLSSLELDIETGNNLDVEGDLTLDQATIRFNRTSYDYTRLRFVDGAEQTLAGQGEVVFDSGSSTRERRQQVVPVGSGAHLIVAAGITIRSGQSGGRIGDSSGALTNNGTFVSETSGSIVDIFGSPFHNDGSLLVSQGARLEVNGLAGDLNNADLQDSGSHLLLDGDYVINNDLSVPAEAHLTLDGNWTNVATLTAVDGTLDLRGTWSNDGSISATDTFVDLGGNFALADLGNFDRTNGTVRLTGTFENSGSTVNLDASTGDWDLHGATILGGAFAGTDGAALRVTSDTTFQDVTLSDLDVIISSNNNLDIEGDLTLDNGAVRFERESYNYTRLRFVDGAEQNIAGQGEIIFDSGTSTRELRQVVEPVGSGAHLVIASGVTVRSGQSGGTIGDSSRQLTNHGQIVSEVNGSTVEVYGGPFSNSGSLSAHNGGDLKLNGLAGDLNTVSVQDSGSSLILNGDYVINENVDIPAGAHLTVDGNWTNTAAITVVDGTMDFRGSWSNDGSIAVTDTFADLGGTFALADLGNFDRTGGTVRVTGTLENAATTVNLDATTGDWQLHGATILGGTFAGTDGAALRVTSDTTFQDVTLSDLDVTIATNTNLDIEGDLTLDNGAVRFERESYNYTRLRFVDGAEQTIAGQGEIVFDSGSSNRELRQVVEPVGSGAHLVIASGVTVRSGQSGGTIGDSSRQLTNHGQIVSEVAGSTVEVFGGPLSNTGSLLARNGGRLDVNGLEGDANTVSLEDDGSHILLDGDYVLNTNITVPDNAQLTLLGSWTNSATLDLANTNLDLNGSFTTADIGAIQSSGSVIRITGTLDNTADTLALNNANGDWELRGGTIIGGTVAGNDEVTMTVTSDGTLTDTTLSSMEMVIATDNNLDIEGDLTLDDATVRFERQSYNYTRLRFVDGAEQTLGGQGEVVFDSTTSSREERQIVEPVGSGAHLIFGSGITVRSGQSGGIIGDSSRQLTNHGQIVSEVAGSTVEVLADAFSNTGSLVARGGGQLDVKGLTGDLNTVSIEDADSHIALDGAYSINNNIDILEGTRLSLIGSWTNSATLDLGEATLDLGGSFATADVGTIQRTGGVIRITGTLDNSGDTLDLTHASGAWELHGGEILGGTVTGGDQVPMTVTSGGTLGGTTLSSMEMTIATDNNLDVEGDLMLAGATVRLERQSYNYTRLRFVDGDEQTLGGQGEVVFDSTTSSREDRQIVEPVGSGAHLIIAAGVTVRSGGSGGVIGDSSLALTNQGQIVSQTAGSTVEVLGDPFSNVGTIAARDGGRLEVNGLMGDLNTVSLEDDGSHILVDGEYVVNQNIQLPEDTQLTLLGTWTNTATFDLADTTLDLGGSFATADIGSIQRSGGAVRITGALDNTDDTLALSEATGDWELSGGSIVGGTIGGNGEAALVVTGNSDFEGVTLSSIELVLRSGNDLDITGDLSLDDAVVRFKRESYDHTRLRFTDGAEQTLTGQGEVIFDSTTSTREDRQLLAPAGAGGHLVIDAGITVRSGGSGGTVGDSDLDLTNFGQIVSETSGSTVEIFGSIFANHGDLIAGGGGVLDVQRLSSHDGGVSAGADGVVNIGGDYPAGDSLSVAVGTSPESHGQVNVAGNATLGGTLAIDLIDGYEPVLGDAFTILSGQAVSGSFNDVVFPEANGEALFEAVYHADSVEVRMTDMGPLPAENPFPADGQTEVVLNPTLEWDSGWFAENYEVYFGTDATLGTGDLQGTQAGLSFEPETLDWNTTYYWRLDSLNEHGSATGAVWSFTTRPEPAVADGTIWIAGDGNWTHGENWSSSPDFPNNGSPDAADSYSVVVDASGEYTITLDSDVTIDSLTIDAPGATVRHTGGTLNVLENVEILEGTFEMDGGRIMGGNWFVGADGSLEVTSNSTLADLTFDPGTVFTVPNGRIVYVDGDLHLDDATLRIASAGSNTRLRFDDGQPQNLTGTGEIVFDGSGSDSDNWLDAWSSGSEIVVGAGITIRSGERGGVVGGTRAVTNHGVISSGTEGRTVSLMSSNATVENHGTLEVLNGATLEVEDLNGNLNTLTVADSNSLALIEGDFSINENVDIPVGSGLGLDGSWTNLAQISALEATLDLNGSWINEGVIGATDSLTSLGGSFALADLGTFDRDGGTVRLTGILDISGNTLTLDAETGDWDLHSGVLQGGRLAVADGAALNVTDNGTLHNATLDSSVDQTIPNGQTLYVDGALTLDDAIIRLHSSGSNTRLRFDDGEPQDLTGTGEIIFDGSGSNTDNRVEAWSSGSEVVVGAGITIRSGTAGGVVGGSRAVTNHGVISSQTAGQTVSVTSSSATVVNQGTFEVMNGATLEAEGVSGDLNTVSIADAESTALFEGDFTINDNLDLPAETGLTLNGTWVNNATISAVDATLDLKGDWTNAGTVNPTTALTSLGGSFSLADLGTLTRDSGTVRLTGNLDLAGETLTLDSTTDDWDFHGGVLRNGTLATADGAQLHVTSDGTFGQMTLDASVDQTVLNGQTLYVDGGLTLDDAVIRLHSTGSNTGLRFDDGEPQDLAGTGEIVFDGSGSDSDNRVESWSSGSEVVVGSGITIRSGDTGGVIGGSRAVTNHGVISSRTEGRTISVTSSSETIVNHGSVEAINGGHLQLDDMAGNTGDLTAGAGSQIDVDGGLTSENSLQIEAGGTSDSEHGKMIVNGTANLGGSLSVAFAPGYAPEVGDRYDFLTANSVSGTFGSFSIGEIEGDGVAELIYDADLVSVLISGAPPLAPHSPAPADGADEQPLEGFLSWSDGGLTSSFDVYFGQSAELGAGDLQGNQVGRSFDISGLTYGTTYFWRIDARNETGVTPGPVWSFATRPEPASISGIVWHDEDEDGQIGESEASLEDWEVYLDLNDNGRRNSGEPIRETGSDGSFSFGDLMPGEYVVRQVVQHTWAQTFPEDPAHVVTIAAGEELNNIDFGNRRTGPIVVEAEVNESQPIPATSELYVTVQFDRELDVGVEPEIEFLPSGDEVAPTVPSGGEWSADSYPNDTYRTAAIEIAPGMDGSHQVRLSGATDLDGRVGETEIVLDLTVNATPPPVVSPVISDTTESSVTIDWSDYSAPDDLNRLRLYQEDEPFSSLAGLVADDGTGAGARAYTFEDLELDREYYVAVGAVDAAGNLDREVSSLPIKIESDIPPALVPDLSSPSLTTALLEWGHYDESELYGFSGYRIYMEESDFSTVDGLSPHMELGPGVEEVELSGLDRSRDYYLAVVPFNRLGEYESDVTTVHWADPLADTITEDIAFGGDGEEEVDIFNPLVVDEGAILTIRPGTTVRFDAGAGIEIGNGVLLSLGTAKEPVHLTAMSESGREQWDGVSLGAAAGDSELHHTWMRHGAGLVLDGVQDPILENLRIVWNAPSGVEVLNGATALVEESLLLLNTEGVSVSPDGGLALRNSILKNNETNAVVAGGGVLDARENWWGTEDPAVIGDTLEGNVDASNPLAGEPVLSAFVGASDDGEPTGTREIDLVLNSPNAISYRVSEDSTFSGVFFEDIEMDESGGGLYRTSSLNLPFDLSEGGGIKTVFVEFRSASGDVSDTMSFDIEYITDGPEIVDFSLSEGDEFTRPVIVTGSASAPLDLAAVEFYADDALVFGSNDGNLEGLWDFRDLEEGFVRVRMEARDVSGKIATREHNVRLNPEPPPAPTISSPVDGELFADPQFTVTGSAEPGVEVRVTRNGSLLESVTAGTDGNFELTGFTLAEGSNEIVARAVDAVGGSSSSPVEVHLDTVPPAAPVLESVEYLVERGIQVFWRHPSSGKRAEEFYVVWDDEPFSDAAAAEWQSGPLSDTSYMIEDLVDGEYYVAVVGMSAAGNTSEMSEVMSAEFDATPPSFTIAYDTAMPMGPGELGITLTVNEALRSRPNLTIQPLNVSHPISVTLSEDGPNTYTGSYAVSALSGSTGIAAVEASGTDTAGNSSTSTPAGPELVLDVARPSAEIEVDLAEPIQVLGGDTEVTVSVTVSKSVPSAPSVSFSPPEGDSVDLSLSGENAEWEGTLTLTETMGTGVGTFVFSAEDALGNSGNTITQGEEIEIYNTEDAPPPPVPTGVEAVSLADGEVAVGWKASEGAELYHLYRAEGAVGSAPTQRVDTLVDLEELLLVDLPPEDGVYRFAVTSERLGSESDPSVVAAATSDRTPPAPPENVEVELTLSGQVRISWEAPSSGETPAGYHLYRNGSDDPEKSVAQPGAVTDAPPRGLITYHVASVDDFGNENKSDPVTIEMFVGAVAELVALVPDDENPSLSWVGEDEEAVGYHVYKDDELLTPDEPIQDEAFALAEPVTDEPVTFYVRAVDSEDRESASRSVTIFPIQLDLGFNVNGEDDNRPLMASYFDNYTILASNAASEDWTFNELAVSRENLDGGERLISRELDGEVAASEQGEWSLAFPGVSENEGPRDFRVELRRDEEDESVVVYRRDVGGPESVEPSVTVSVSADSAPLAGGLNDFTARFYNRGYADMDLLLVRDGGAEPGNLILEVLDEGGTLVHAEEFDKPVSGMSTAADGRGYLRVAPGQSTEVTFEDVLVPEHLGETGAATIRVRAPSIYNDLGGAHESVSGPLSGSMKTNLTETPYYGVLETNASGYTDDQPILLTGQALDRDTDAPVANADLQIGFHVRGYHWFEEVTTDESGAFSYEYTPSSGLAGELGFWAAHPDVVDVLNQAEASLLRILPNPSRGEIRMSKNDTLDFELGLVNPGEIAVTPESVSARAYIVEYDEDLEEEVEVDIDTVWVTEAEPLMDTLDGDSRGKVHLRMHSTLDAPDVARVEVTFDTEEGATAVFQGEVTLLPAVPILSVTSPKRGYVDRSLDRGDSRSRRVTIQNDGLRPLEGVEIVPPENVDWMQISLPADEDGIVRVPDLEVGDDIEFQVVYSPPEDTELGFYDDVVVIRGENASADFEMGVFAEITSNLTGQAQFAVTNILDQEVPNASVRLRNSVNRIERGPYYTDSLGEVLADDLQEGRWSWQVTAPGHSAATGTVDIEPDQTTMVEPELNRSLVSVTFQVVPVPFTDRYEIKIEQTFETRVPAPVLVMNPPMYEFENVDPGFETTVVYKLRNEGLISLHDVEVRGTESGILTLTPLIDYIPELKPDQTVEIPGRLRLSADIEDDLDPETADAPEFGPITQDSAPSGSPGGMFCGGPSGEDFAKGMQAIANMGAEGEFGSASGADLKKMFAGAMAAASIYEAVTLIQGGAAEAVINTVGSFIQCAGEFMSGGDGDGGSPGRSPPSDASPSYDQETMGCFLPDTPVLLASGESKPIREVEAGDHLRSGSGKGENSRVQEVYRLKSDDLRTLHLRCLDGERADREIHVTGPHRLWRDGTGWTHVSNLEKGDWLSGIDSGHWEVVEIERVEGTHTVYNFQLTGDKAFYADGVLAEDVCGGLFIDLSDGNEGMTE